jgi:hypothetical protein
MLSSFPAWKGSLINQLEMLNLEKSELDTLLRGVVVLILEFEAPDDSDNKKCNTCPLSRAGLQSENRFCLLHGRSAVCRLSQDSKARG